MSSPMMFGPVDPCPVTMKLFGESLHKARLAHHHSAAHTAARVGLTVPLVTALERGDGYLPSGKIMKRLGGAYPILRSYQADVAVLRNAFLSATADGATSVEVVDPREPPEDDPPPPSPTPTAQARTFGEALRRERDAAQLSHADLSRLLDVVPGAVFNWEKNRNCPILDHYQKLLDLFPALAEAPFPPVRDIAKPPGSSLWFDAADASSPSSPSAPAENPPMPPPSAAVAPPVSPTNMRAFLQFLRDVRVVRRSSEYGAFRSMLETARRDEVPVAELIEALDGFDSLTEGSS